MLFAGCLASRKMYSAEMSQSHANVKKKDTQCQGHVKVRQDKITDFKCLCSVCYFERHPSLLPVSQCVRLCQIRRKKLIC